MYNAALHGGRTIDELRESLTRRMEEMRERHGIAQPRALLTGFNFYGSIPEDNMFLPPHAASLPTVNAPLAGRAAAAAAAPAAGPAAGVAAAATTPPDAARQEATPAVHPLVAAAAPVFTDGSGRTDNYRQALQHYAARHRELEEPVYRTILNNRYRRDNHLRFKSECTCGPVKETAFGASKIEASRLAAKKVLDKLRAPEVAAAQRSAAAAAAREAARQAAREAERAAEEAAQRTTTAIVVGGDCPICLTAKWNTALTPCGHTICSTCVVAMGRAMTVRRCPVCRSVIHSALQLFF